MDYIAMDNINSEGIVDVFLNKLTIHLPLQLASNGQRKAFWLLHKANRRA